MTTSLSVLLLFMLIAAVAAAPQKITACDCDGTADQQWEYPSSGALGFVTHVNTGRCWANVPNEGCDWGANANHSCIELINAGDCGSAGAVWNATAGFNPFTVIFKLVAFPELCADWNGRLSILELYPCYGNENKQQEWFEDLGAKTLMGDGTGDLNKCLCPDPRIYTETASGSSSASASASSSASASASTSATATATPTASSTVGVSDSNSRTLSRTASQTPSGSRSATRTPTHSAAAPAAAPASNSAGLSPGAAAGVSLVVIAGAAAAGVWVFATYFGGGPAVTGAFAAMKGYVGVGSGAAAPPSPGSVERLKLLSPTAAAARLGVPTYNAYGST